MSKPIEEKRYARMDKFTGAAGTWGEWSFGFITTTQGLNAEVGKSLEEIVKSSETTVTNEAVDKLVPSELRDRHGKELFVVLAGLPAWR